MIDALQYAAMHDKFCGCHVLRIPHGKLRFCVTDKRAFSCLCNTDSRVMPDKHDKLAFFQTQTFLQLVVLGWMRKTEGGYNLFIQVRYWSWWGVETESQVEWLEWAAQQCDYFTKNNLMFVGCQSPICIWYRLKCKMYNEMAVYQYIVACVMSLALILQFRALLWTTSFSPRELRYAFVSMFCAMWSFVITFFGFDMAMDAVFSQLDRESYYPNPPYYVGTYFLWIVMLLCLMRVLCNGYLYAKAREYERTQLPLPLICSRYPKSQIQSQSYSTVGIMTNSRSGPDSTAVRRRGLNLSCTSSTCAGVCVAVHALQMRGRGRCAL
ncbi:unnamed protein product [Amoebophrya sp. A120]|nr:unnamed protein product [Amoebophrya sp. A120]|eukprot:GSA120T00012060001.1